MKSVPIEIIEIIEKKTTELRDKGVKDNYFYKTFKNKIYSPHYSSIVSAEYLDYVYISYLEMIEIKLKHQDDKKDLKDLLGSIQNEIKATKKSTYLEIALLNIRNQICNTIDGDYEGLKDARTAYEKLKNTNEKTTLDLQFSVRMNFANWFLRKYRFIEALDLMEEATKSDYISNSLLKHNYIDTACLYLEVLIKEPAYTIPEENIQKYFFFFIYYLCLQSDDNMNKKYKEYYKEYEQMQNKYQIHNNLKNYVLNQWKEDYNRDYSDFKNNLLNTNMKTDILFNNKLYINPLNDINIYDEDYMMVLDLNINYNEQSKQKTKYILIFYNTIVNLYSECCKKLSNIKTNKIQLPASYDSKNNLTNDNNTINFYESSLSETFQIAFDLLDKIKTMLIAYTEIKVNVIDDIVRSINDILEKYSNNSNLIALLSILEDINFNNYKGYLDEETKEWNNIRNKITHNFLLIVDNEIDEKKANEELMQINNNSLYKVITIAELERQSILLLKKVRACIIHTNLFIREQEN